MSAVTAAVGLSLQSVVEATGGRRVTGAGAQPIPQLVSPTSRQVPVRVLGSETGTTIGPPLSPWQVSMPPPGTPAQSMVWGWNSGP